MSGQTIILTRILILVERVRYVNIFKLRRTENGSNRVGMTVITRLLINHHHFANICKTFCIFILFSAKYFYVHVQ